MPPAQTNKKCINLLAEKKMIIPFHGTGLFLDPLKHQKISGFLLFLGGIERNHRHEMG